MAMTETLSVPELARRCAEETARYQRGEAYAERFCFELFRRAIVERDNAAWSAIYAQYTEVVRRWIGTRMDPEEGVVTAFERFWRALDSQKFPRFNSLAAVLQYLKMCVYSVAVDQARAASAAAGERPIEAALSVPAAENVEGTVARRLDGAALWAIVQRVLADEHERLILYLSYAMGLTPREICAKHGDRFPQVQEVYRIKRNALDRLRRSPEMQGLL